MNRKLFLVIVFVLLVLGIFAIPVLAGPPGDASRTWYYHPSQEPVVRIAGGNQHMEIADFGWWEGTFDGLSTDTGSAIVHRAGNWSYRGVVILEPVTVDDKTGVIEMKVNGSRPDAFSEWSGTWVIIDAHGELEGLHGSGKWWGPGWQGVPGEMGVIPYNGKYHFEPSN